MKGQVYFPGASQSVSVRQTGRLVFLLTLCLYGLTAGGSMATMPCMNIIADSKSSCCTEYTIPFRY